MEVHDADLEGVEIHGNSRHEQHDGVGESQRRYEHRHPGVSATVAHVSLKDEGHRVPEDADAEDNDERDIVDPQGGSEQGVRIEEDKAEVRSRVCHRCPPRDGSHREGLAGVFRGMSVCDRRRHHDSSLEILSFFFF